MEIKRLDELALKEYAPLSFWAWNEEMDDVSICQRIQEFHDQGMGGFFMHSRAGLVTQYLSEEWFRACRTAAKKAGELGMEAWIYDEDGWPSGFAGGLVNGCGPEYQAKYLVTVKNREELKDKTVLASFRKTETGYEAAEAEDSGLFFCYMTEPNYVDLLSRKVTEKFIEVTHERYKRELGEYFGTVVPGFFTDEPQYSFQGFPYSDELETFFQTRNGYSFLQFMYLFEEETQQSDKFRKDYWDTIQEMMRHNFAEQIYEWCEKNGVKFTGHFPGEDSFIHQMSSTAGVMPKYKYMQMPGIDHLGRRITPVLLTKQVTSAAKQYGKKKILSETFGCAGWNVSFEQMCHIWGWQAAAGINVPVLHIGPHSIKGIRKRDYPAFYSYQEPWWEEFHHTAGWLEGIGFYMGKGRWTEDVLVLTPLKTMYLLHRTASTAKEEEYAAAYRKLLENLLDVQVGFDLGDEEVIRDCASVEKDHFVVGNCAYRYVIVPKADILEEYTWKLLGEFQKNGGTVLFTSQLPRRRQEDAWAEECHIIQNSRGFWYKCFAALHYERKITILEDNGFYIAHGLHTAVKQADSRYVYIWNRYTDSRRNLTARIPGLCSVYVTDPETGKERQLEAVYGENETLVPLCLEKYQSVLLEIRKGASQFRAEKEISRYLLDGNWEVMDRNALTLDYASFSFDGQNYSREMQVVRMHSVLYREAAKLNAEQIYVRYRFYDSRKKRNPVTVAVEDDDCTGIWCNDVPVDKNKKGWYLDRKIHEYGLGEAADEGWNTIVLRYQLPEQEVKDVDGLFETEVNRFYYPVEPEAVYLLGNFSVDMEGKSWRRPTHWSVGSDRFLLTDRKDITDPSDVVPQGLWFYRGDLKFSAVIEKDPQVSQWISFEGLEAAAVKITANGKSRLLYMAPYEADLTDMLSEGENTVEIRLLGTNRNLLGPHHHIKGENNYVGPNTFKGVYGYEDKIVNPDVDTEETWTDRYSFVPFGCKRIWISRRH